MTTLHDFRTLDAMWGYRTARYVRFGWAAARLDVLRTPQAAYLHAAWARQGILTRLFDEPSSLRFGLPGNEAAWARLDVGVPV